VSIRKEVPNKTTCAGEKKEEIGMATFSSERKRGLKIVVAGESKERIGIVVASESK